MKDPTLPETVPPELTPPVALRLPVMLWLPVKWLLADNCGTTEVLMDRVPLCVMGPPVRPNPLPTLVTVPVPGKVWPATKVTFPVLLMRRRFL